MNKGKQLQERVLLQGGPTTLYIHICMYTYRYLHTGILYVYTCVYTYVRIYSQTSLQQHFQKDSLISTTCLDCILVYGSTTKGDAVKRSDCILVYGSTTKGDVVNRSDCIICYLCTYRLHSQYCKGQPYSQVQALYTHTL